MRNSHETRAGLSPFASSSRSGRPGTGAGDQPTTKAHIAREQPLTITAREVAKMWGRSTDTIFRREKLGEFPKRLADGGNPVLYIRTEVFDYLRSIGLPLQAG